MVSKKLSIYGFISAATVVSGILAGCGGSSSGIGGASTLITATGGNGGTSSQVITTGVGAQTTPQQVQVTQGSSAYLPAGESIPAGASVAILPVGPILPGLAVSPRKIGAHSAPQTTTIAEIYDSYNGGSYVDTGIGINASGVTTAALILLSGNHKLKVTGNLQLTSSSGTAVLSIGTLIGDVLVTEDGSSSVTTSGTYALPGNGSQIAKGAFVTEYFTSTFAGYAAGLTIKYGSTTLRKVVTITNFQQNGNTESLATFNALSNHPAIPASGVDSIEFGVVQ